MLAALLLAAVAGTNQPAKLVVINSGQSVAITDFPTMERCERAKASLEAQALARANKELPGYKVISLAITSYCIPG